MTRHLKQLTRSFAGGEMSPEMFSRIDDGRYLSGAALMRNMICRPQGTAIRRPGSQFIRRVRDSALGKRVRMIPFSLANGDTYAIEAGRVLADNREIGYFRFHTDGGTLLYDKPRNYVTTKTFTGVSPFATTAPGNTLLATLNNHGLQTGDPITISYGASASLGIGQACGSINVSNRYSITAAALNLEHGQPVIVDHGTMPVLTNGKSLERGRVYYVHAPTGFVGGTEFGLAATQFGQQLTFSGVGTVDGRLSAVPSLYVGTATGIATGTLLNILPTTVLYARVITANTFQVASTYANALSGVTLVLSRAGYGERRMHYAYQPGDMVYWTGLAPGSFQCMRVPYGRTEQPNYGYYADHVDHPPPQYIHYWCRSSGSGGTDQRGLYNSVTVDTGTDRITWPTAHGLENGEPVIIYFTGSPAPGVINNGDVLYVRNKGTNDFEVSLTAFGNRIDITAAGTGVAILAAPYYDVPHYYSEDELFRLGIAQSNDVLTLASATKPVTELRRMSSTRWERSTVVFGSGAPAPVNFGCRLPGSTATLANGVRGQSQRVTVASLGSGSTPAGLTTTQQHQFAKSETLFLFGLQDDGVGRIPDGDYQVHSSTITGSTTLSLAQLDSGAAVTSLATAGTGYVQAALAEIQRANTYVVTSIDDEGTESNASSEFSVDNNLFVPGAYNPLAWDAAPYAVRYRVYKKNNSLFGLIGETEELNFSDDNITPDLSIAPPVQDYSVSREGIIESWNVGADTIFWTGSNLENGMVIVFETNDTLPTNIEEGRTYYVINAGPDTFQVTDSFGSSTAVNFTGSPVGTWWAKVGFFPGTVSYFEGRRCFTASLARSQDVWMTSSGTENDMSYSLPTVDSDRIRFRVAVREAASMRHLIPMTHLLLLSNSTEIRVTPVNDDTLTPLSISLRPQSYVGSDYPQPVVVNNVVVFSAARGGHIRELGYSQETNSYLTGDLSLRAAHLFDDFTIVQMAYQKAPVPTVWIVSSNGKLLGMTYLPDESIGSWHQHDTDGVFESVVCLPEGEEDVLYVSVLRGATRYIERISRQRVVDLEDCFYVDNGITYDGASTTTVIGLDHLNGKTVNYLADGAPGSAVVSGGSITLSAAASKVQVGLPIMAQIKTIPLSMQVEPSGSGGSGRLKNINAVWVRVNESGQFQVGPSSNLLVNSRSPSAGQMLSELVPVTLPGSWTDDGQILIQVSKAVPLNVTGLTIEVAAGG